MGEERDGPARGRGSTRAGGLREFASSALLLSAVVAILLAGLALRSEPPRERVVPPAPEPAALPPPPSEVTAPTPPEPAIRTEPRPVPAAAIPPRPKSEPPEDGAKSALAARAKDDLVRIGRARAGWTAQLVVACVPDTVDRLLRQARGAQKLYVLPAEVHGDSCFRVCWGSYANAKDAAAAKDLPAALRGSDAVRAVSVAKVLP